MDEENSGRMVFILLDVKPYYVNGKLIEEDLGELAGDYVSRYSKKS